MRAGIDHAVFIVVVGQVGFPAAGIAGIEGKFQDLHVGISGVPHKPADGFRDISQVFRDDGQTGDLFFNRAKEIESRAVLPPAGPGVRAVRRDRIVLVKTAEVVDPDDVKEAAAPPHAADPPGKAGLPVMVPVIQGISPELADRGKAVRRNSCDRLTGAVLTQLEELRIGPDLRAVRRDIDGYISDDGDPLQVGVGLERSPLHFKAVLQEGLKFDLIPEPVPRRFKRCGLPHAQGLFPFQKSRAAVLFFQCHKKGIIRQPGCVFFAERRKRNPVRRRRGNPVRRRRGNPVRRRKGNPVFPAGGRVCASALFPPRISLSEEGFPRAVEPGIVDGTVI